jgi:phosphate transport system protein
MGRTRYDHQIESLRQDLLRLGSMVEQALSRTIKSLATQNGLTASWIIQDDVQINYARHVLEEETLSLLATQQPVAGDLRFLNTAEAIAAELERIGDYACAIALRVERMTLRSSLVTPSPELFEMAALARQMLHTSLEAFLNRDGECASSLEQHDQRMDEYESHLRAELIELARKNPQHVEAIIDLLDIIHALERVADRATTIGERVTYLVNGTIKPIGMTAYTTPGTGERPEEVNHAIPCAV